jgi:UDP-glucuronate 4-epimerase
LNKILVTGTAGFIGFHLSKKLIENGWDVVGIDNLNNYYDVSLKENRLKILSGYNNFTFKKVDLADELNIRKLFSKNNFEYVVNLAAQAGVRYSTINPHAYVHSNLTGFLHILEGCRHNKVKHLIYASSSSVYGANSIMPFSVHHNVDHPLSLYAATKKANELLAHTYSVLYNLPTTGLRFFTVYGPWGRPDMALFLFTKAILENKSIDVYNFGKMKRDFTYIDDIVEGVYRLISKIPEANPNWNSKEPDPSSSFVQFKVYNIGNNKPVELMHFIELIEENLGKKAVKNFLPIQPGDVNATYADIDDLSKVIGFKPSTTVETGIKNFIEWYKEYYKVK